ncbi:MAG: sulfite exporter TauE/SafE family protein [Promethearchaeota archaeon]
MFDSILTIILLVGLISLSAALAGTVGIGGGGFFSSILMIIGGLSISVAIPIASIIIVGVGLASTLVNIQKKTINYKLALILEPTTILGTIIGIQLHLIVSETILIFIFSVIMICLTVRTYLKAREIRRSISNKESDPLPFDSEFSSNRILYGMIGSLIAGMISALVGIGGGLIKVPMLTELGLSPEIASGTGSFMVLFTSISTAVQFLLFQRLDLKIGIIFFFIGFFASLLGSSFSRYNTRPDVFHYFLSLAMGSSTFLILLQWLFL